MADPRTAAYADALRAGRLADAMAIYRDSPELRDQLAEAALRRHFDQYHKPVRIYHDVTRQEAP